MSSLKKIAIRSLETGVTIQADFNPKELSFTKSVGWADDKAGLSTDFPSLQFTAGQAITLSVELFFDLYETGGDVRGIVAQVMSLALVDKNLGRPPLVQLIWADENVLFSQGKFTGVVDQVQAKYTMFHSSGVPCRATVTVAMKQAEQAANGGGGGLIGAIISQVVTFASAAALQCARPDDFMKICEVAGVKPEDPSIYPITLAVPMKPEKDEEEESGTAYAGGHYA